MRIRQAELADNAAIELIARVAFVDAYREAFDEVTARIVAEKNYNENTIREMITDPMKRVYVYVDHDTIEGFAIVYLERDVLYLRSIYIFPSKQRQGIGTKLLEYVLKTHYTYKKAQVDLENGNNQAYDFYKRSGFEQIYCTLETVENVPVKFRHLEKEL